MSGEGINFRLERKQTSLLFDTRSLGDRLRDALSDDVIPTVVMACMAASLIFLHALTEFVFLAGVAFFFYARSAQKKAGLALRMPKSSGEIDPKELSLKDGKPTPAEGIVYMGNDLDTGEEVWLTDTMARTHMLFMGTTGSGKAQPLDALVHTPTGWQRMGDIAVGDLVSLPAGGSAPVSGVFPQGKLPIYRITFADGRSTEACGEHLWEVHHKHWNGKYKPGVSRAGAARPRTLTTKQLIDLKACNSGVFSVRLPEPVELPRQDLPLHPYMLGVLLGDGCFTGGNVRLSSDDDEVFAAVEAVCPDGVEVTAYACQHPRDRVLAGPRGRLPGGAYARNPVRAALCDLDLDGVTSEAKFVPEAYKNASVEQRRELLCGLMDADGFAGAAGSVSFCSVSRRLAEDVQYLVRSLGGIASITEKTPTYTHKGEKRVGRIAYNVNIRHPEPSSLFTLARKADRVASYQYADSLKLGIERIELVGEKEAQCIMVDHEDHLYITNDFVVTHNTEYLVSLVYNSLIHGSGLIYVDGKADSSLYGKVYSMARAMGREDDVLVINFQTGAKDIYGAQPNKLSNTLNPFAVGSSGMLSELVKGLMATGEKSTWTQQAESFVEALMKPLVYLRDKHGLLLDVNTVREYFELNKLEDLAWRDGDKYPGLVESGVLDGLHNYLLTKPAYKKEKYHDQSETTNEQHGYITMQLIRTFNSLSDTYGYIMKTPLAEIDFVDVFLNRRILVVLLPALEKSPSELTNLGRIVVASIKATMAKGLGSTLEGEWAKVIDAKPTTAPSPFMCVLDEYGYYAVEGFAVVPAQARSLGFSAIFAGQDLPAFEKASKEEAASTLANTNTRLCGKLECTKTYDFFNNIAGKGLFTKVQSYENDSGAVSPTPFKANDNINIDRVERVSFEALRGQQSGYWHLFFANTIVRVKSFFANPKPVKMLRVNHFIKVGRPDAEEVEAFRNTTHLFARAVGSDGGLMSYMDRVSSPTDIIDIHAAFEMFKKDAPLLRAGKVLAYCAQAEARRAAEFTAMTAAGFGSAETADIGAPASLDIVGQMTTGGGGFDDMPFIEAAPEGDIGHRAEPRPDSYSNDGDQRGRLFGESYEDGDDTEAEERTGYGFPVERSGEVQSPAAPAKPEFDPEDPFYGVPDDVVEEAGAAAADDYAHDGYGDGYGEDPVVAARAQLLPASHDQTNIFGIDQLDVPEAVASADNDVVPDAFDRPQELSDIDDDRVDDFDAPMADDGLLSREATISGLAAIERASGAPETESLMTASAVAEAIADSTTYPISAPAQKPDLAKFESIAQRLSQQLSMSDEEED